MDSRLLSINRWIARSDTLERIEEILGVEHASDCALHNGPALPPGPCDCGAFQSVVLDNKLAERAR